MGESIMASFFGEWRTMDETIRWLEDRLAFASNLIDQAWGGADIDMATTGPADDPDRYDAKRLLADIRSRYPSF